jgi:uncharacterized protein (TIGR02284 family)
METRTQTQNKDFNTTDVNILNDLSQINQDRITGYEKAIKFLNGDNAELRETYSQMIKQSGQFKNDIQSLARTNNSQVTEKTPGVIYQTWMSIKESFTDKSDQATLKLCEHNEAATLSAYKEALTNTLNPRVKELVQNQREILRKSNDQIKKLSKHFEAAQA